jgi:hypothetical protein
MYLTYSIQNIKKDGGSEHIYPTSEQEFYSAITGKSDPIMRRSAPSFKQTYYLILPLFFAKWHCEYKEIYGLTIFQFAAAG